MGKISELVGNAKAWWQSKTIIAALLTAITTIAGLFGYDLGDVVNVTWNEGEAVAGQIDAIWVSIQTTFGFILTAWMRIKAEVKVKGLAE